MVVLLLLSFWFLASCSQSDSSESTSSSSTSITNTVNASAVQIDLDNPTASSRVEVSDSVIKIVTAGYYELSGTFDGQILVEVGDEDEVTLILNGVNITNTSGSAIAIMNAKDAYVELAKGSVNVLTDGSDYDFEDGADEPNATLFSKDDLHIQGEGALTVNAKYNDGISSKDDLEIESGNITVVAVDDGIRGKNSLTIDGGVISVTAQEGDALKADNEEEGSVIINDGDITLSAGDDGIHAEISLEINDGTLAVTQSYEGLESLAITINGGDISITSSDDGFNVAGGNDQSGEMGGGRSPGGMETASADQLLTINGGNIVVNAGGDGLDSNGYIVMTGGNVIVYGPTNDGNGALDYNGSFTVTGGTLIAMGSSGMAQNISTDSSQYGILVGLDSQASANSVFSIRDSNGNVILEATSPKTYSSVVVTSPEFEKGGTYTYSINGTDGGSVTLSSITSTLGTLGRMWGGGFGSRMMR